MPTPGETGRASAPGFSPATARIRNEDWTVAAAGDEDVVVVDSIEKTFGIEELLYSKRDTPVMLELDPDGFLFSYIQTFSERPECVLPDRADISSTTHCLRSYARYVRAVAARRGARIAAANDALTDDFLSGDERVAAEDLLQVPRGRITEQGVRQNIREALAGIAAIIAGSDAAPNASTIELCRAQLWQWVRHETGVLDTGRIITPALFDAWLDEELDALRKAAAKAGQESLDQAAELLRSATRAASLADSLVDEAYRLAK